MLKSKTDILIVDIGNTDTAKGQNVLANAEKILKKVRRCSPETKKNILRSDSSKR